MDGGRVGCERRLIIGGAVVTRGSQTPCQRQKLHAQFHPSEFCAMTGADMGCERMLGPERFPLPWLSRLLLGTCDMLARPVIHAGSCRGESSSMCVCLRFCRYRRATIIIADAYMKAPTTTGMATYDDVRLTSW